MAIRPPRHIIGRRCPPQHIGVPSLWPRPVEPPAFHIGPAPQARPARPCPRPGDTSHANAQPLRTLGHDPTPLPAYVNGNRGLSPRPAGAKTPPHVIATPEHPSPPT